MKNILHISLVFLLLNLFSIDAGATHMAGADITWKSVGKDSFEVTMTVYRDCNGVNLINYIIQITPSCASKFNDTLSLFSVEEITPVCDSINPTRCGSGSSNFPYGMQKVVLKTIVDLSGYNCCEFTISWKECCRSSSISTGGADKDFYIETKLSKCDTPQNSSPRFTNPPLLITCVGQCIYFNNGAVDDDGDSLVYSLTPPLQSAGTPASYSGFYSYDKPLYFFGFPNKNLSFNPPQCRGFHLDSFTGNLMFRPMQSQVTIMAIKVEEYRDGKKIGEVTRDFQLIITNCPSNDIPDITGVNGSTSQFVATACPDKQLCFNINTSDANSNDSVEIEWNAGIPGASFNITQNGQYQNGTFCWTPDSSHIRENPYFFTVTAKDNACPIPGTVTRSYWITVKANPPVSGSLSATVDSCNFVNFFSGVDTARKNIVFEWSGEGGFSSKARNPVYQYDSAGTYWYYLRVRNADGGCEAFYDSAQVTVTSPLRVVVTNDTLVCPGTSVLLSATPQYGKAPYDFSWSTGDTTSSITVAPLSNGQYTVLVTDSFSCTTTGVVKINAYTPYLQVNAGNNISTCISVDSIQLSASPTGGSWKGAGVRNDYFLPLSAGAGKHILTYQIPDSNGCMANDQIQAEVFSLPKVTAGADTAVCINSAAFALAGAPAGGNWFGTGVNQNKFEPATAGAGVHNLTYSFVDANGCSNSDSITVTVHAAPKFTVASPAEICLNAAPVALGTSPAGAVFSGKGISDSSGKFWFIPSVAGKGNAEIVVFFTDSNNCRNIDTIDIIVHALPAVSPGNYAAVCENGNDVQLGGAPSGGTWSGTAVNGNVFSPAAAGAGSFLLTYTFTDTNNCTVNNSTTINVNDKPTAAFTHSPDSGATPLEVFFTNTSSGNNLRYMWFMGDKFNFSTTDKNPSFTYRDTNRTYDVMLLALDTVTGCADTFVCRACVKVLAPVGIKENLSTKFKVFPNPAQNELTISGEVAIKEVMVTDLSGKTVIKTTINREKTLKLDLTALAAGTYLVYITTEEGVAVKKVVVGR